MKKGFTLMRETFEGFTLVELLLVVTIITTIAVMSNSFYSRFLTQNDVQGTVDQFSTAITTAQFYAIESRRSDTAGWGVNFSAHTITIYQGNSYATRNPLFDEKVSINPNIIISGFTDINFQRITGVPSQTVNATIQGLGSTKTLTLNSLGVIGR